MTSITEILHKPHQLGQTHALTLLLLLPHAVYQFYAMLLLLLQRDGGQVQHQVLLRHPGPLQL